MLNYRLIRGKGEGFEWCVVKRLDGPILHTRCGIVKKKELFVWGKIAVVCYGAALFGYFCYFPVLCFIVLYWTDEWIIYTEIDGDEACMGYNKIPVPGTGVSAIDKKGLWNGFQAGKCGGFVHLVAQSSFKGVTVLPAMEK